MINRHQVTPNTVGLWQFDGDLTDSSGNGYDLSVFTGQEEYSEVWPGVQALYLRRLRTILYHNVTGTSLKILGDMTIEMIVNINADWPFGYSEFVSFGAAGESSDTNYAYLVYLTGESTHWFQEYGSGSDVDADLAVAFPGQICHLAFTRRSSVVRCYCNGILRSTTSALTDPTDCSNSVFWVGGPGSYYPPDCVLTSLKILDTGLLDNEIQDEYNYTLGDTFGKIT